MTSIEIRGARTHNLKGIDADVPKHRLVVFTGVSGSSRSSLVFDTVCPETQRQLVETFSTYARRRLPQLTQPAVDAIRNISPCIVIDQKPLGRSSRSTAGTVTEIYTYLRMLFSRCGRPSVGWSHRFSFNHPDGICPVCKGFGKRITVDADKLLDPDRSVEEGAIRHPAYDIGRWHCVAQASLSGGRVFLRSAASRLPTPIWATSSIATDRRPKIHPEQEATRCRDSRGEAVTVARTATVDPRFCGVLRKLLIRCALLLLIGARYTSCPTFGVR